MSAHTIRFTAQKIDQRLKLIQPLVYRTQQPLPPFRSCLLAGPQSPAQVAPEFDDSAWVVVQPFSAWGEWRADFVLRTSFQVPPDWSGCPVALLLELGEAGDFSHPEALAYVDGQVYAACDRHHHEIILRPEWLDGCPHALALVVWTGLGLAGDQLRLDRPFMGLNAVARLDQPLRDFIAEARVALGVAEALSENHPSKAALLTALDEAFKILDTRKPFEPGLYQSVPAAHAALKAGLAKAGPAMEVDLIATGHAHIDMAWLWPLGQSRQKAARTFSNVLRLMERFPNFHFTQSQPQLYDFIRQDHPGLFSAIQQRAAEGRWEPTGGMWVEADCNLSGAEALARQFLLGRAFFRKYFGAGADSPVLWLPDVFGYAWTLPQLIQQAGMRYFFTIKIGWNQYNRLPYDTFWWQGLDGTRLLTHFSTAPEEPGAWRSTYNAMAAPWQVLGAWENFQQKELRQPLLMTYGYGDGGGGPTAEMLENLETLAEFPGAPRARQDSAKKFFEEVEACCAYQLPTWNGELYLELHRGTYTTQARVKRLNRRSEFLLHDADFLAAYAARLDPAYPYPAAELGRAWELVCLNQFHDILPGSSIGPVYDESARQYAEVRRLADGARSSALQVLARETGGDVLVVNPTSFARRDLALLDRPLEGLQRLDGTPIITQPVEGGTLLDLGELPPYSLTPLQAVAVPSKAWPANPELSASPAHLENDYLRIELDPSGDVIRLYDKGEQREVLLPGARANQFQAFEDRPLNWDAWDIDIFYEDHMWLSEPADSVRVVESGPLRIALEIERRILHSRYTQRISLAYNSPRLDFITTIDWQERHILLKAAFPLEVLAPQATYEIQWGSVQRPTHRNTGWDWARFETCAHKWADLSEGGYGVSLLNDCKYGHDIHENVIRLSLLRGPTSPDPFADLGEHHFTYSLLPHTGGWGAETVRQAYLLNDPLLVWAVDHPSGAGPRPLAPLVSCPAPNIVIETVKRAEDGDGLIVRLYECQRRRGPVTIQAAFPLQAAWITDLLEGNQQELDVQGNTLTLPVRPFQIVTLRLK